MKKMALLICVVFLASCGSPVSKEAKMQMQKPVNCSDAKEDIAALENEKASVLRRVGQGARFVVPVSVVVNIFQEGSGSDNVKDRNSIAAGDYNKEIDAKIAEIKSTCNA
jgi:hypothetical protein